MMNSKLWLIVAALVSVVVLFLGWFIGISPQLDAMNAAEEQRANVDAQNASYQMTIDQLQVESQKIDEFKTELKEMQVALPPGGEFSTFLGQLHELEVASGVELSSFSASTGTPFSAVPNGTDTVVSSLVTPENFIVISVDLNVSGTRTQVLDFVHDLQFGKRLFLVNSLGLQSGGDSEEDYKGNISGFIYVLVDPSAPPPSVTPPKSVSETPSPSPTPEG